MVDTTSAVRFVTVAEAADRLGVTPRRVQALVADHQLRAMRAGQSTYLVVDDDVVRREALGAVAGRPLSPRNAWAVILIAAGEHPGFVDRRDRYRLRLLLKRHGLVGLRPRLRSRARTGRYRVHPGELDAVALDSSLMLSGANGAARLGLGLSAGDTVEGYVAQDHVDDLVRRRHLREAVDSNVVLRLVPFDHAWLQGTVAPLPAIALDLSEDTDPRAIRLGNELLVNFDKLGVWPVSR